jgi:competence protein ComEC
MSVLWRRLVLRGRDWLAGGVGIGMASMLAGAPLIIAHFNLFSAGSMFANLIVVPISFPVMVLGFTSVALGVCGLESVVAPINWLAGWNLQFLAWVTQGFANIPGMSWTLEYRAAWIGPVSALVFFVVFLAFPFSKTGKGWWFFIPPLLLAFSLLIGARGVP